MKWKMLLTPKSSWLALPLVLSGLFLYAVEYGFAQTSAKDQPEQNALLNPRPFLQIPGPNPIILRGPKGAWDEAYIEAGDITKEDHTYYFYYHGAPIDHQAWGPGGYRIGGATAEHPLGPWTKMGDKPLIDVGEHEQWDAGGVACPVILKEKPGKFLMWYCGTRSKPPYKCSVGLATAPSPNGPWTRYAKNPVIDFCYVSSVVKANGKYYMYAEYPVGESASDMGPMALAIGDSPEGPWVPWAGNPVLPVEETGAWDDAGYSESKVLYRDGVFHMFYGGAKEFVPRILGQESIGYAYSFDGKYFVRYGGNPVALRESFPNASAFSEVHALFEPPFIYAFHTLRYLDPKAAIIPGGIDTEDLGVEVLVTPSAFTLPVPVIVENSLAPHGTTNIANCRPISLNGASRVTITAKANYEHAAKAGMRIHIRSSADGKTYDTVDLLTFDNDFQPGSSGQKTVELSTQDSFIKAFAENLDGTYPISSIKVMAVLSGH
jgi:hypothetical protein